MVVGKTCVAGFRYLIPVMPGNWAWIPSSSTEPSGSTCTLTKRDGEILRSENKSCGYIPHKAPLPLPRRLIWSPVSFLSSEQLPDISEVFESFNHLPKWPVMQGVKKKSVWFRLTKHCFRGTSHSCNYPDTSESQWLLSTISHKVHFKQHLCLQDLTSHTQ